MKEKNSNKQHSIKRIGGHLHRVIPISDKSGKIISYALKPFMVEFKPRDAFQVIVGASILAIPVAFTEEVWTLGEKLPFKNIVLLALLSMFFIASFAYLNIYKSNFKDNIVEYIKRVLGTYLLTLIVVLLIMTIIQKCPWESNFLVAIKRIIIVSFPASMSATISDTIK